MTSINIKKFKYCAFCKYWYDPLNEAVKPKVASMNYWEINPKMQKQCLIKGCQMKAIASCQKYECKIYSQ